MTLNNVDHVVEQLLQASAAVQDVLNVTLLTRRQLAGGSGGEKLSEPQYGIQRGSHFMSQFGQHLQELAISVNRRARWVLGGLKGGLQASIRHDRGWFASFVRGVSR